MTPLADRQWKGDPVRSNGAGSAEPLMTAGDVASLLGVTRGWVDQQSRLGRIPTVTLGRYRRYRREAIEAWLVEMEVGSLARRDGYAAGSGGPRGPQVA